MTDTVICLVTSASMAHDAECDILRRIGGVMMAAVAAAFTNTAMDEAPADYPGLPSEARLVCTTTAIRAMTLARGTDRIASERLLLRRIDHSDFEFFSHLHADPEVARYLSHGRPRSLEESIAWLQSLLRTYEDFELGQLAVLRKSDGMLIGRCGLSDLAVEATTGLGAVPRGWYWRAEVPPGAKIVFERELGYTFHRSSWGHGYASEAAALVFDYARDVLKLSRVVSLIHPENVRSLRVAQRFGVQHEDAVEVTSRILDRFAWPIPSR